MILPEEISIFADFIQDISTVEEEYIGYIQNVIDGEYENFEITLNTTSVIIKKNETIVEHNYRIEEPLENKMETKEFIELLLIWKEKIPEIFED
ncbi:tRNA-Val4 [Bacillus sp. Je.9.29.b]|uniref:tRNA-Val4 n=1 Tax=Bacillus TaxID=1386 RepID=UPI0024819989|nr:tRNA-Val4 [Bacillus safensis]MDI0274390.1 tRNA-Val4 [Bacillus safensis]MEC1410342.1 tRNA-Val4 [Bacillus safensis]